MRTTRLALAAVALLVALGLLFSRTALAAAPPEPSQTLQAGGSASFIVAGFSLSANHPAPASVQVVAHPNTIAQAQTWSNIVYYAVDWGIISTEPEQVQAALWYVTDGAWPSGAHTDAQRLVDTARASASPASAALGNNLVFAIANGQASASVTFSANSGSVAVSNLQANALTIYLPYGTILAGADGLPAYVIYPVGSSNPPPAPTSAQSTVTAAPTSAEPTAALPTAQPTASAGQPSATPTVASNVETATPVGSKPTPKPSPTATVSLEATATAASNPASPTSTTAPATATIAATSTSIATVAPPATSTSVPPTATAEPTNTPVPPTLAPAPPANNTNQGDKPAVAQVPNKGQAAAAPTEVPTDQLPPAEPTDQNGGLPTELPTIFPSFTPRPSGVPTFTPASGAIPSATSVFLPTATTATGVGLPPTVPPPPIGTNPTPAAPTKPVPLAPTPTIPVLPNDVPPNATPPGPPNTNDTGASGATGNTTGKPPTTTPPTAVTPTTGEQSSLPIYLLIGGLIIVVAGVVALQMSNRRARK